MIPDETIAAIARVCHEVNRAYCEALGDHSQPAWEDAPDWQKQSAIAGVQFHLFDDHGPEASHESWMKQKVADGWVYGEKKDPDAKTHPCMVPFDQLPPEQKAKDYLFRAVVKEIAGYVMRDFSAAFNSLRDHFAGQALTGILASGPHDCEPPGIAHDAYWHADAMLCERKQARRRV